MSRLSMLYKDLHSMLTPVLPPSTYIMTALTSPLSPTSSPLRSARNFLHEVLDELRKNCAPARDGEVDAMLTALSSPESETNLPSAIVQTIRCIFQFVEEMTDDLHNFALSNLTEGDIVMLITLEAHRREFELVSRLYGGLTGVWRTWNEWLSASSVTAGISERRAWRRQLLSSLAMPSSISIVSPPMTELPPEDGALPAAAEESLPSESNALPSTFLISSPTLFRIQNLLQALVITSCVRLLAFPSWPRPAPSSSPATNPAPSTDNAAEIFVSRIWALLVGEIDRGGFAPAETKLVNFEDEVWSAVRSQHASSSTLASGTETLQSNATPRLDEAAVRANVQRLLRTEDPVFALLIRRVTGALANWLESRPESEGIASANGEGGGGQSIPTHMQTGRKRPGLPVLPIPSNITSSSSSYPKSRWDPASIPAVKGFEGKILREALEDVASQLGTAVEWVEITWSDVIDSPESRLGSGATHA